MLPPRLILRVVLSFGIIALVWYRALHERRYQTGPWLFGTIAISIVLLLVVIAGVHAAMQKRRNLQDDVPKKPLGLD